MEETKPWYLSRTNWTAVIGIISGVMALFGHNVSSADQTTVAEFVLQAVSVISSGLVILFRNIATKKIAPPKTEESV